jgi:hypothetical protein
MSLNYFDPLYDEANINYNKYYKIIKHIITTTNSKIKKLLFETCKINNECFSNYCVQDPYLSDKFCGNKSMHKGMKRKEHGIDIDNILETKRIREKK